MKELKETINDITAQISSVKLKWKVTMTNRSTPLDERWQTFVDGPDWLKDTSDWIRHFDSFGSHTIKTEYSSSNLIEDALYEHASRSEHLCVDTMVERLLDMMEAGNATLQDVIDFKEEMLSKNFGHICYDW